MENSGETWRMVERNGECCREMENGEETWRIVEIHERLERHSVMRDMK